MVAYTRLSNVKLFYSVSKLKDNNVFFANQQFIAVIESRLQAYWSSNAAVSIVADSIELEKQLNVLTSKYNYYIGLMTDFKESIQLYREKVAFDMTQVQKFISSKNFVMVSRYYYTMFIPHYLQFRGYIIKYMQYLRSQN